MKDGIVLIGMDYPSPNLCRWIKYIRARNRACSWLEIGVMIKGKGFWTNFIIFTSIKEVAWDCVEEEMISKQHIVTGTTKAQTFKIYSVVIIVPRLYVKIHLILSRLKPLENDRLLHFVMDLCGRHFQFRSQKKKSIHF